jgi:hypothetical protein
MIAAMGRLSKARWPASAALIGHGRHFQVKLLFWFSSIRAELISIIEGKLKMSQKLVVIGGGAGGPSAAAKAKRLDPDLAITIVQKGEHVSFAA